MVEITPTASTIRDADKDWLLLGLITFKIVNGGTAKAPSKVRADKIKPVLILAVWLNIDPIAKPNKTIADVGKMMTDPKIPPYSFNAFIQIPL